MKLRLSKKQITWGITAFLVVAASIMLYTLTFYREPIIAWFSRFTRGMMTVVYGVLIAYILTPVLNFIERRILIPLSGKAGIDVTFEKPAHGRKWMRRISVVITMIFAVLVMYLAVMMIAPQVVQSVLEIARNFPRYVNNVYRFTNTYLENQPEVQAFVNNALATYSGTINDYLKDTVAPFLTEWLQTFSKRALYLVMGLFNFLVGMIIAVYLLYSKETMCGRAKKMAYAFFKESWANEIVGAFRFVHYTFIGFITGKLLDSILVGVLCYVGVSILGLPYPVLLSVIIGLTNIIPFFGPYIGMFFGSLLLVLINPVSALVFLVFVVALQQVDGNIIGPRILGDSTGLSGFWVIFSILFFGALWGFAGWIIGVPVFAVIYAFVRRLTDHLLTKRGLTTATDDYIDLAYIEEGSRRSLNDSTSVKYNARRPSSNWKRLLGFGKKSGKDTHNNHQTGGHHG